MEQQVLLDKAFEVLEYFNNISTESIVSFTDGYSGG